MAKIPKNLLDQWSKHIKQQQWHFQDHVSIGGSNNLSHLIKSIFPSYNNQQSNNLSKGYHFLYCNQPNDNLGHDWYDNYQAPMSDDNKTPLFTRRMWVSGQINFNNNNNLMIGQSVDCYEKVKSVRTIGDSIFTYINRTFNNESGMSLTELRSLVYLNENYSIPTENNQSSTQDNSYSSTKDTNSNSSTQNNNSSSSISSPVINGESIISKFTLTYTDIIRYCALTYNVHKIHHNVKYSQDTENLPDVIVPGPFMVTLILAMFPKQYNVDIKAIKYKNVEPILVNTNLKLVYNKIADDKFHAYLTNQNNNKIFIDSVISV